MADIKEQVNEYLDILLVEVAKQLVDKVRNGEDIRAAIDFLKNNKRSVTEEDVLGSKESMGSVLDQLVSDLTNSAIKQRR